MAAEMAGHFEFINFGAQIDINLFLLCVKSNTFTNGFLAALTAHVEHHFEPHCAFAFRDALGSVVLGKCIVF
jgi:hypothetical protein